MGYNGLDKLISKSLNLGEGCVFILKPRKYDNLLEFSYPDELKGFTIPVMSQSVAGKAVIHRSPIILNNFQGETDVIYLNCLTMNSTKNSIRKMIAYPVCSSGELTEVLLVVRKEYDGSDLPNFLGEDLQKIKSAVDKILTIRADKPDLSLAAN
jgi:hypothetical protein